MGKIAYVKDKFEGMARGRENKGKDHKEAMWMLANTMNLEPEQPHL